MDIPYFLACFILSSFVAGQSPIYELRGQKVSLKPHIPGPPDSILWKQNGNKVVEFTGKQQDEYGRYKNRISLDWHTADLEITDLRFEDSGDYEVEVYIDKKFSTSLHKLEVIDLVAKPTISCEMNDGGGSNKSGTLLCSAEPRQPKSLMRFEWRSHGNLQPGTKLTISLGDEYDDEVYRCRVSNPLSEETTTFTAKDCYPENDSVLIHVLVTITVVSLSLFLMGLGIFCCKQHNKACFAKRNRRDSENPTQLGVTQGNVRNLAKKFESGIHGETLATKYPAGSQKNKDKNQSPPPDLNHLVSNERGDADEDELRESAETEVPQCENTPEPAVTISSTAAEQSGNVRNLAKKFESGIHGETLATKYPAGSQKNKDKNKSPPPDLNHLVSNERGDADEDELRESAETEVPQCENTPEPAVTISSTAAEQSESDKETAEDDENRPLLERRPTPPTTQPRNHVGDSDTVKGKNKDDNEETGSLPSTPCIESHSPLDPSIPARNDKGDADADRLSEPAEEMLQHRDSSDSEKENEPKPADVSTNTMSDLESSPVSKHQEHDGDLQNEMPTKGVADEDQLRESADTEDPQCGNTPEPATVLTNTISSTAPEQSESDKETAEDDENRPLLERRPTPPTTQPRNHVGDSDTVKDLEKNKDENEETGSLTSTPHSLDPSMPARNDNGDADADRLSRPAEEVLQHHDSSDSEKENEPKPADVSTNTMSDLESSPASEHQDLEKDEDGKSPPANVFTPVPKPRLQLIQNSPNTAPEVTVTSDDNQQERDKPDPAAEKESGSEGNSEEPDVYSGSSLQPQSSTPTQPDKRSNDTFKKSPDATHEEPGQQGEGKTTKESQDSCESEDDTGEDKN